MAEVGFDLESMLGQYRDYARGYLFKFEIDNAPNGYWKDKYPYLVRTTALPDSTLDEITTNWQGMAYKIAATQVFADITVTFNVDAKSTVRHDFVNWVNMIHNPSTNRHGRPSELDSGYMCTPTMTHLDTQGNPDMVYTLHGAWPKTVGTSTLDYANKDTLQFDVTFSYQYHTTSTR